MKNYKTVYKTFVNFKIKNKHKIFNWKTQIFRPLNTIKILCKKKKIVNIFKTQN